MTAYLVRRVILTGIALFAISSLIFLLLHLQPGGPCGVTYVPYQPGKDFPAVYQPAPGDTNCVDYFHLDEPLVDQYFAYVGNIVRGNLGVSLQPGTPAVSTIISDHLPTTLLLLIVSFTLQLLIALPLGMYAALRRYSFFDGAFSAMSYVALSTPPFILGMVSIYVVAVDWGLLPSGRASSDLLPVLGTGAWFAMLPGHPGLLLGDMLRHLILPATTLAVIGIALDSRFMRAAMMQVLDQEYIRTARAKGVPRWRIVFKHAFRNALPPIITNTALYLPALIGSAMVVETVFSYTGIGYTFTQAILEGNVTLEQAVFLLSTTAVLVANLLADVAYGVADPRVRFE